MTLPIIERITWIILLMAFSLCSLMTKGQNLVQNPGFEEYTKVPLGDSEIKRAKYWDYKRIGKATPDYYHTDCITEYADPLNNWMGKQAPHGGEAYAGIFVFLSKGGKREYIQNRLTDSLQKGHWYSVQFYLSLAEQSEGATSAIGVIFSNKNLNRTRTTRMISFSPHIQNDSGNVISDNENWVVFSGIFMARGGERYMIIGNYVEDKKMKIEEEHGNTDTLVRMDKSNAIYYYVDDVSLIELGRNDGVDNVLLHKKPLLLATSTSLPKFK